MIIFLIYTLFGAIMVLQNVNGELTEIRIPRRDGKFTVGTKTEQNPILLIDRARAPGARLLNTGSSNLPTVLVPDRHSSVDFP